MKPTLSIIVPVYQHEEELRDCLRSLEAQTFKDFEVIVVDDGSSKPIQVSVKDYRFPTRLLRFEMNRGAPAARNQGFKESTGDFVMFLDADVVLRPHALQTLYDQLTKSDADFAYPSFYWGKKKFSSRAFDVEALKEENYVHTSALIKRAAFPGFDETLKKLQDWDLFLTMAEQGKRGVWIDETLYTVKPRSLGMSQWVPKCFYDIPWKKLGWTPKRIQKYEEARKVIEKKHDLRPPDHSFAERLVDWMLLVVLFEALSFVAVFFPVVNSVFAVLLSLVLLYVTAKRPTLGLTILLTELLIGGKGELFKLGANAENNGGVSIRVLFFVMFLLGWAVRANWKDIAVSLKSYLKGRGAYVALALVLVWSFLNGFLHKTPFLLQDANAWGFLLLLLPAIYLAEKHGEELFSYAKTALVAGLSYVSLKTILLFYLFSHPFGSWVEVVYYWIRKSGVGEITRILEGASAHRIFFQSHIFEVLALIPVLATVITVTKKKNWWQLLFMLCLATVIISFSRSFWIGAFGSFVLFTGCVLANKKRKIIVPFVKNTSLLTLGSLFIVVAALLFPLPWPGRVGLSDAFVARFNSEESALQSRWILLPALWKGISEAPILGHGFGSTITYSSLDPRVVQTTGGEYTTYAFEWGWLDFWYKFGILGIPVMLWLLIGLAFRLYRLSLPRMDRFAAISVLITLALVHVFTPYLNHPIGFTAIILLEGFLVIQSKRSLINKE